MTHIQSPRWSRPVDRPSLVSGDAAPVCTLARSVLCRSMGPVHARPLRWRLRRLSCVKRVGLIVTGCFESAYWVGSGGHWLKPKLTVFGRLELEAGGWSWNGVKEKYCWAGWSWSWWLEWCEKNIVELERELAAERSDCSQALVSDGDRRQVANRWGLKWPRVPSAAV